jgi:hypothetical protein
MSKHLTEALTQAQDNLALLTQALEQSQNALKIAMSRANKAAKTAKEKQNIQMAEMQIKNLVEKAKKGENVTQDIERISKQYKQK